MTVMFHNCHSVLWWNLEIAMKDSLSAILSCCFSWNARLNDPCEVAGSSQYLRTITIIINCFFALLSHLRRLPSCWFLLLCAWSCYTFQLFSMIRIGLTHLRTGTLLQESKAPTLHSLLFRCLVGSFLPGFVVLTSSFAIMASGTFLYKHRTNINSIINSLIPNRSKDSDMQYLI